MPEVTTNVFPAHHNLIDKMGQTKSNKNIVSKMPFNNNISLTLIFRRSVKYVAKILACLVIIPVMAVVEALSGFVVGVVRGGKKTLDAAFKKHDLLGWVAIVTAVPVVAVSVGLFQSAIGFGSGIKNGVKMAMNFSLDPAKKKLKSQLVELKNGFVRRNITPIILL